MSIDYGSVHDYSDRGFGFVSRILGRGTKVFFHIKTVRRKYPQLAAQLDEGALRADGGAFRAIAFWYDTEPTPKGEQVRELWLQADEMPEAQKAEARATLERMLRKRQAPLPSNLQKIAQEVFEREDYDRLHTDLERRLREKQQAKADRQRLAEEQRHGEVVSPPPHTTEGAVGGVRPTPAPPPSPVSASAQEDWWAEQLRSGGESRSSALRGPQVIETRVVGVTYEGRQAVVAQLSIDEQVRLRREPTNPYDPNAIRVERLNGQQIGYISRSEAALWAPLLDRSGGVLPATVTALPGGYSSFSSLGVRIRFVLPAREPSAPPPIRDFDETWES